MRDLFIFRAALPVFGITLGLFYSLGLVYLPYVGFSTSIPYHLQTEALLQGKFSLSENPCDTAFDFVYYNGSVQQVWGLGVPLLNALLSLPFYHAAGQLIPDRLVLYCSTVSVWLLASFTVRKMLSIKLKAGSKDYFALDAESIFLGGMLVINPWAINILRTELLVYQEAVYYAALVGIAQLCLLLLIKHCSGRTRIFFLVLLAWITGYAPLVRPTCIFYSIATMVACALAYRKLVAARLMFLGTIIVAMPLVFLLWSNDVRFGSPLEFGHSLNIQNIPSSMYQTRILNNFDNAPMVDAVLEVFGALYGNPTFNSCAYLAGNVVPMQSSILRWREFNHSSLGPVSLLASVLLFHLILLNLRRNACTYHRSESIVYVLWTAIAWLGLFAFYMGTPVISSRYMYDFIAVTSVLTVVPMCLGLFPRALRIGVPVVMSILILSSFKMRIWDVAGVANSRQLGLIVEDWRNETCPPVPHMYSVGMASVASPPFNMQGWNPESGECDLVSVFWVREVSSLRLELDFLSDHSYRSVAVSANGHLWPVDTIQTNDVIVSIEFRNPNYSQVRERRENVFPVYVALGTLDDLDKSRTFPKLLRIEPRRHPSPKASELSNDVH